MNLLWVVNTVFPDAGKHLGIPASVYGGWMYGLAADIAKISDISLSVATVYNGSHSQSFKVNDVHYYLIPQRRTGEQVDPLIPYWRDVVSEFLPDIVHIHGTEFGHGMSLMSTYPDLKYLVSIQGLVSVCHRYFMAGLSTWDVLRSVTVRDLLRRDTLFQGRHDFFLRGEVEKEYIRKSIGVIGRTEWDFVHVKAIRPNVSYYFCNESLRDEFYSGEQWSLQSCQRHSVFVSQSGYPIKGLHQALKAVALLKNDYPDIRVTVAGPDITRRKTQLDRLKRSGYGQFICKLVKRYQLDSQVQFLGPLQAEAMKQAYLRAHVFVCPSSIENSPNSLGEAQILGVPCIATYSGGIPSMVQESGSALLYPFDEYEMLASKLSRLFMDSDLATKLSRLGMRSANIRHSRAVNLDQVLAIYQKVMYRHEVRR